MAHVFAMGYRHPRESGGPALAPGLNRGQPIQSLGPLDSRFRGNDESTTDIPRFIIGRPLRSSDARSSLRAAPSRARPATLAAEPELFGHRRTLFRVGWGGQRMVARQLPAPQIFANLKCVPHGQVAAQGLAFEPTLEANHLVALYRSPDRYGRRASRFRLDRFPKLADGLLHRDNQR